MSAPAKKQTMLSPSAMSEIQDELDKYPVDRRQSALMAALRIAQDEHGWLSNELIEYVADVIQIPAIKAYEVATFYSMYDLNPTGKYKLCLCTNISCMLRGSDEIADYLQKKLGIRFGETTKDGKFTLKEVECLAACAGAPMMQIGHDYYEDLTPEKVDQILEHLE